MAGVQLLLLFVGAWFFYRVLIAIPGLGFLGAVPLLGFLVSLAIVSTLWRTVGERMVVARRRRSQIEGLGRVDTPHMRGKLGAALMDNGRARAAREPLEEAAAGEPEVAEWRWRLARLAADAGETARALELVRSVTGEDEEYAYGRALLLEARLLAATGDSAGAVDACERFARNHGDEPEGLFELGRVHAARGDRDAAKAAFARAATAVSEGARFKRRSDPWLGWKARLRSLTG